MKKPKSHLWKILIFVIWPLILFGLGLFYCVDLSGFSVGKIKSPLQYNEEWEAHILNKEDQNLLQTALSQDYFFLGNGVTSYSFVSNDQNYIIKFFKMRHLLPKNWLNYIPIPKILDNYRFEKIDKRNLKLFDIFASCKLAFEELHEETGLLFIHLNKTRDLKKKIKFIDQEGKSHLIDLDAMEFVIQKKAIPFAEKFKRFKEKNDIQGAQKALQSILYLALERSSKRILNKSTDDITSGYGFIGNSCVHLNVAGFCKTTNIQSLEVEFLKTSDKLKEWVHDHYPELEDSFEQDLEEFF